MGLLKGITVTLWERMKTGTDPFGADIFEEVPVQVENVLVAPADSANRDTDNDTRLYGKRASYTLAIPKGDAHTWEDSRVSFFGADFRTVGFATEGIEAMIPGEWNRKISVERFG